MIDRWECNQILCKCWLLWRQINNPDMRVVILNEYAKSNFPSTPLLDYAYEVEKITTSKVMEYLLNGTLK